MKNSIKNTLKTYVSKYKKLLGLEQYRIDVAIANDTHYISDRNSTITTAVKDDDYASVLKIGIKEFLIVINKHALNDNLKDTVIHELLHVLLWEIDHECNFLVENILDVDTHEKHKILERMDKNEHVALEKLISLIR